MNIKRFVNDCVSTFVFFVYEGLIILLHFITEILLLLKKLLFNFLIPFIIDLYTDIVYIAGIIQYEALYHGSVFFLKLSQLFSSTSKYLLNKAEEYSHKKAW